MKWRLSFSIFLLVLMSGTTAYRWWERRLEHSQDQPICAAARRYDIESALVKAVVWRESKFRPHTRGRVGEIGLMQLREEAAQEWADAEHLQNFAHANCFDAGTNTMAGAWYLKKLLKRYRQTDNPVPYALADYNAGRGNVLKWLSGAAATNSAVFTEQIRFPGTKEYVQSVMRRYEMYRPMFAAR